MFIPKEINVLMINLMIPIFHYIKLEKEFPLRLMMHTDFRNILISINSEDE